MRLAPRVPMVLLVLVLVLVLIFLPAAWWTDPASVGFVLGLLAGGLAWIPFVIARRREDIERREVTPR